MNINELDRWNNLPISTRWSKLYIYRDVNNLSIKFSPYLDLWLVVNEYDVCPVLILCKIL